MAEIRLGKKRRKKKKEEVEETTGQKYNVRMAAIMIADDSTNYYNFQTFTLTGSFVVKLPLECETENVP